MKRRTPTKATAAESGLEPVARQRAASLPAPPAIPEYLARWTGNLLYWVTSLGAQYYAEVVAPFGLLPAHVAVLQVLANEGALRQARLTDRTRIDKATMVGLLNEMERQGLIERHPAPNDKRAFDVRLTPPGSARLREIEIASEAAEAAFYGVLSPDEHQQFREMLVRLSRANGENP